MKDENLELKHLVPYLPYKLEMIFESKGGRIITLETLGTSFLGDTISGGKGGMWLKTCGFKPILRPLSDLTKPIIVKCYNEGKEFVPQDEFLMLYGGGVIDVGKNLWKELFIDNIRLSPIQTISYGVVQNLLEWNFDVFELISKGLAIDINTLRLKKCGSKSINY